MKAEAFQKKRIATYSRLFNSADGEFVLNDLRRQFGGTTLRKVDGKIDPHASLAAAGCQEVYLYIEQMMSMNIPEDKSNAVA